MQFTTIATLFTLALSVAAIPTANPDASPAAAAAPVSEFNELDARGSCPAMPRNCSRCSAGKSGKSNSPKGNMGLCMDKGMESCVCVMTWMSPDCSACGGADGKGNCKAGDYKGTKCLQ